MLLEDIAGTFNVVGQDRISSEELVERLVALETRPWGEYGKTGKAITKIKVANLLRQFGIAPKKIRFGSKSIGGYTKNSFLDAFSRYLSPDESEHRNKPQNSAKNGEFNSEHPEDNVPTLEPRNPQSTAICSDVPTRQGDAAENAEVPDEEDLAYECEEREAVMNESDGNDVSRPLKTAWDF